VTSEWSHEEIVDHSGPALFDATVAHFARVYDYWLGGKDNIGVDRAAAEAAISAYPDIVRSARANRAFLARAVRFLAAQAGIRQFLDIGTGLPTVGSTHEVAQSVDPASRVVYVDNDPIVLSHARAMLASHPAGATEYLDADLRDPKQIADAAAQVLDFRQPVAVLLMTVLQHIEDEDQPGKIVAALMGAVPAGSYLAVSHPASDIDAGPMARMADILNSMMSEKLTFRSRATVAGFFDGLDLVEPGIVQASAWRPSSELETATPAALWAGVARKK
jgi:S-adenosyl methyltransferase